MEARPREGKRHDAAPSPQKKTNLASSDHTAAAWTNMVRGTMMKREREKRERQEEEREEREERREEREERIEER